MKTRNSPYRLKKKRKLCTEKWANNTSNWNCTVIKNKKKTEEKKQRKSGPDNTIHSMYMSTPCSLPCPEHTTPALTHIYAETHSHTHALSHCAAM